MEKPLVDSYSGVKIYQNQDGFMFENRSSMIMRIFFVPAGFLFIYLLDELLPSEYLTYLYWPAVAIYCLCVSWEVFSKRYTSVDISNEEVEINVKIFGITVHRNKSFLRIPFSLEWQISDDPHGANTSKAFVFTLEGKKKVFDVTNWSSKARINSWLVKHSISIK